MPAEKVRQLQLGGSIQEAISAGFLKLDEKDMYMVVMCGMVISALFGTPITAAVFALGVTSVGIMYSSALVPCLMSSLAAFLVTRFADYPAGLDSQSPLFRRQAL